VLRGATSDALALGTFLVAALGRCLAALVVLRLSGLVVERERAPRGRRARPRGARHRRAQRPGAA